MVMKPNTTKLNPRKMMEKAVEVMKSSIHEPRDDGKAIPMVGAVLVKPDGSVDVASRGELRHGDHAEYTLIERKNRSSNLAGALLFSTLEPCAPGSRSHPKLGCAERIVNARIKAVWVGIEDPDPMVDRKGIKFLQKHKITVHMFDRDLQEAILDANKLFISQALERKAAADEVEENSVVLSKLEIPLRAVDFTDFSSDVLERYRDLAKIADHIDSEAFLRRLTQQGLLSVDDNGKSKPSGFGMLLFGKTPRDVIPQAGLLGTIHYPEGKEEVRDFAGPLVQVPGDAIQWLKDKLPNPIGRTDAQRTEAYGAFYEMVREGVVNALVHRDYDITGAKCHLIVTPDAVIIKSPGAPVDPITLEQLQSFNAPLLSRNPMLHYIFAKMALAEERGLGLKSMKARATENGLPLPKYGWEEPYLVLTLYRNVEGATRGLGQVVVNQLSAEEREGWAFLSQRAGTTQSEYAYKMGVTARTAQRHLTHFVNLGLLRRIGRGPATEYAKN